METKKFNTRSETGQFCCAKSFERQAPLIKVFNHDLDKKSFKFLSQEWHLQIDTETEGLDYREHKLLLVQIATVHNEVFLIRFPDSNSYRLRKLLSIKDFQIRKYFHNAAFDLAFLKVGLQINVCSPIECTRTLAKIVVPHMKVGLASLLREILNININKKIVNHETKTAWKNPKKLSKLEQQYASSDVIYLYNLWHTLNYITTDEQQNIYWDAMKVIPIKVQLEVEGYTDLLSYEKNDFQKSLNERHWYQETIITNALSRKFK